MTQCPETGAVVVAYRPDPVRLLGSLRALKAQCDVVLVDNSDVPEVAAAMARLAAESGSLYVSMEGNRGIAAAQNAGLARMLALGKQYLLLLDDDSRAGPDMVRNLSEADRSLRARGEKVGAVGARARSAEGKDISNAAAAGEGVTRVRDLMSSGSLIRSDILMEVGWMEEGLFIDCVDFEWGWRAQAKGLDLFLLDGEYMDHSLGTGYVSAMGLRIGVPSPVRHYYQYRNVLRMLGRGYVPLAWKARQLLALAVKPVLFLLLARPRLHRLRYMLHGVRDAALGRVGAYRG